MDNIKMIEQAILNRIALTLNNITADSQLQEDEISSCIICNLASAYSSLTDGEESEEE